MSDSISEGVLTRAYSSRPWEPVFQISVRVSDERPRPAGVEWVRYNVIIVVAIIIISRIISTVYKHRREHDRNIKRKYLEKKWLGSRSKLIKKKRAALSAVIEQLRQEICQQEFSYNIIDRCGQESLYKLETQMKDSIRHVEVQLSELEDKIATLRSKIATIRSVNFTDSTSCNVGTASTSANSTCETYCNVFDFPKKFTSRDSVIIDPLDIASISSACIYPPGNHFDFGLANDLEESQSVISEDTQVQTAEKHEDFNQKAIEMLSLLFPTQITASMLILRMEDLALKYNATHKQCIEAIINAILTYSKIPGNCSSKAHVNIDTVKILLNRFSKLVSYFMEFEEDQKIIPERIRIFCLELTDTMESAQMISKELFTQGFLKT